LASRHLSFYIFVYAKTLFYLQKYLKLSYCKQKKRGGVLFLYDSWQVFGVFCFVFVDMAAELTAGQEA